ncbi:hypothetical protein HPB47_024500, partial [Ixodes persulcatus]
MSASTTLQTTEEFVSFARESIAQLCCFNALLWEALIGLVVGRARLKHFLCFEYFRRKTELFQELYFTRDRNRCSSLSNKPTSKAGIYRAIAAAVRSMNFVSMIPPLEVFCREVDECHKRPLIIFEENYCRFGQACELCGTRQEGGKEALAHCSRADSPGKRFTPMLFADSGSEDGFVPSPRCKPAEKDAAAWKKSCDFYWAKRWMKLLITTPKHLLIWSEANGGDKTFDEIGLCGERLAQEVANYLDNIGATNFKLSFVGFSLGCVTIRAALTCPQMRPYIKNLNTFLSLHGPHLGVLYANNKFLRFPLPATPKRFFKKHKRGRVLNSGQRLSNMSSGSGGSGGSGEALQLGPPEKDYYATERAFIFVCICIAVSYQSFAEFPYLIIKHGGVCFFISYTIVLFLLGIPMAYLEMLLGQFRGRGCLEIWSCVPIGK